MSPTSEAGRGGWWHGAAIYRVQDNYVVQWGNNESEKPLPAGVVAKPPAEYHRPRKGLKIVPLGSPDAYAPRAGFAAAGRSPTIPTGTANLAHCYAMVGVGRDLSPDTGTGGELYAVIGHAPRHLDRNIAVVGRIVSGIEHMSPLPRGTEALGFYKERSVDVPIASAGWRRTCPRPSARGSNISPAPSFAPICTREKTGRTISSFVLPAGQICATSTVPVRPVPAG